jgi:tetratricopeptide (TPR) repeat protein
MKKIKKPDKSIKLETDGDRLAAKGKFKKALVKYRKALEYDPDRPALYDKLVAMLDKTTENWELRDFVDSVSWTMKKQELSEPAIRQIHAKLSPDWKKASDLAVKIILAPDDDKSLPNLIEELVECGETGTMVLIEIMRGILKESQKKADGGDK